MARILTSTNDTTKLRMLLENNQDVEAMALATRLTLYKLSGYPIDVGNAVDYMFIAVAFTRNNRPEGKPLEAMQLSAATPQRYAALREKYDELMQGHENRIHPFRLYLSEIGRSVRRLFK